MKKIPYFLLMLVAIITHHATAQVTTIVNYDFNSGSSYPIQPGTTASNISCSGTSSEAFQTYTGTATGSSAFVQNSTAGNALAMANSGGANTRYFLFHLGGSDLNSYSAYSLYLQPQRSSTGATTITVAYSTNGSAYTNLATTYTVGTSFSDVLVDLSTVTTLNYATAVYIKLMVSGASQTTGTIRIDNLQVQATKGPAGGNPFQVNGYDVSIAGKLGIGAPNPMYPLEVTGNSMFHGNQDISGTVIARQGLTFDGSNGIKYALNPNGSGTFQYGNFGKAPASPQAICAAQPYAFANHQFGGWMQIYDINNPNTSGLLNFQTWAGGSSIDASINGETGGGGLLLNYFCGNNTYVNTGANGGKIFMGEKVSMAKNVGIGNSYPNENFEFNTALNVFANDNNMNGIKLNVWNGSVKAINLVNPSLGNISNFVVWQNGKTQIGFQKVNAGPHQDAMLTVAGKIAAKEVQVFINTSWWADYVFDSGYKLMSLNDVEKYYKVNKHLPDVPSTNEVVENGNNLAQTDGILLRKIEENTLYLVEMNKKLEQLVKENEELKNKVKALEHK